MYYEVPTFSSLQRNWLQSILLSLGIIIFIAGCIIAVISSRRRYPNYRIVFLAAIFAILYYISLLICWLIKKLIKRMGYGKKE